MPALLRFEQGSRTDVGRVRSVNEDAYLVRERDALWAVADGMGGHAKGRWASSKIVGALEAAVLSEDFETAVAITRATLEQVSAMIFETGQAEGKVIGSTVTVLLVREHRYAVLWAGDSRLYRFRDGVLSLLTTDHSQVEQMVVAGLLTRQEAEEHPLAHMLSRAVGAGPDVQIDSQWGEVLAGDMFLLCSDGLTRTLEEREIAHVLERDAPHRAATALVELALDRGAADNVTVVVLACDETTYVAID